MANPKLTRMRARPLSAARLEVAYRRVRSLGLATPGVSGLVRRVRARTIERAYLATAARYASIPGPTASTEVMLRHRSEERLFRFRHLDRKPRILFVGTDYLQDASGTLQALSKIGEVTPFVQSDGTYGQRTPDRQLSFDLAIPNALRILELAATADDAGRPFDLLVGQMLDGYIDGRALSDLRDLYGTLIINIGMDDRHAFAVRNLYRTIGTRGLVPHIDLAATTARESVDWYRKDGCPAIFFPEASDPDLFRPMPEVPKRYDVSFVGARYGIRQRIVERIQRAGIAVEARGSGWPRGRIPTEEVPELFAASRIILGVGTIGHSESLYALKLRDFDAPMSGSCYLTHDNSDLHELFEIGREIAVYRDDLDCVRVVRQLLNDDEGREEIARRGRQRALRDHTWVDRFTYLISVLRGTNPGVSGASVLPH